MSHVDFQRPRHAASSAPVVPGGMLERFVRRHPRLIAMLLAAMFFGVVSVVSVLMSPMTSDLLARYLPGKGAAPGVTPVQDASNFQAFVLDRKSDFDGKLYPVTLVKIIDGAPGERKTVEIIERQGTQLAQTIKAKVHGQGNICLESADGCSLWNGECAQYSVLDGKLLIGGVSANNSTRILRPATNDDMKWFE